MFKWKKKTDPYRYKFLCRNCDIFFESENSIQRCDKSSVKNIFNLSKNKKIMKDKKGKRGRKIKKENNSLEKRKTHKKTDFDNLLRKIQVHFLNFLIDFCNEALKTEFDNFPFSFKRIKANTKEKINSKNIFINVIFALRRLFYCRKLSTDCQSV